MLYRFDKLVGSGDVTFVLSMDEIEPFFWNGRMKGKSLMETGRKKEMQFATRVYYRYSMCTVIRL